MDDKEEVARRVRAAMAYADLGRSEVARRAHIGVRTLDRITGRGTAHPRGASWEELWAIADVCDIPREWFTADIDRLHEIVPEGMPVFVRQSRRASAAEASRLAEAAARRRTGNGTRTGEAPARPGDRQTRT